ncbi:MAG: Gfo/Idh/MocA family oxidoreductase [Phycisphaerae bacterium]|nr:Gfo/Idh/MocA family oxidoreductase [Phycisphaerae bacterium]
MTKNNPNRRSFLKSSALGMGACLFPGIIPSTVLGRDGAVAPSNKIGIGCVGMGMMGPGNMGQFLNMDDVQVVGVADIDKNALAGGLNQVKGRYGQACQSYHEYREMFARKDIDAVMLAVPDHWHAIAAIDAAKAGLDIYGEKPLSHTFEEGLAMCKAVERYGRIWQTGSWQRSESNFRIGAELVRNGRIGKLQNVEVGLPSGYGLFGGSSDTTVMEAPATLDYDRWLGPAPYMPYSPARVHRVWRWNYDYGGGQLMDWVGHHVDIAHWGMGMDESGPVEVYGTGDFSETTKVWNAASKYNVTAKYANGVVLHIADSTQTPMGTKWIGDQGWIYVDRGNVIRSSNSEILKETVGAGEIKLYDSKNHWRNFIDCIKTRQATITPCQTAHRSATVGHLGLISIKLGGRKIKFDPVAQKIIGDFTARRMLGTSMRSPWKI